MVAEDGSALEQALTPLLKERAAGVIADDAARGQWAEFAARYLALAAAGCSPGMRDLQADAGVALNSESLLALRQMYGHLPEHLTMPHAAERDDDAFLDWLHRNARPWSELTIGEVAGYGDGSAVDFEPGWFLPVFDYRHQRKDDPPLHDAVVVLASCAIPNGDDEPLRIALAIVFERVDDRWIVSHVNAAGAEGDLSRRLVL